MVMVCAGIGASLAAFDLAMDWIGGRGRFAPRPKPQGTEPSPAEDPALAQVLSMLEWPDEKLAHHAAEFTIKSSRFKREPRLIAGCERLARIGLSKHATDADRIVKAALRGLDWLDATDRISSFEPFVIPRTDLPETKSWLSHPATIRRRKASGK